MTRPRRYLLILGLLALAGLVALSWQLVKARFPNLFDRETVDAAEVEKLKAADLTRPATAPGDWPQYRGPAQDGVASADGFNPDWKAKPPKVLWTAPCGGGFSSCAVAGGVVYTQDRKGDRERVLALDADTGTARWVHEYAADYAPLQRGYADGPRATPTVHDGRVYTVGAVGKFVCLALPATPGEQPRLLWAHDLKDEFRAELPTWGVACSPLVEGDLVVVQPGGRGGSVVAFDRTTGEKRWAAGGDPSGYSTPVAATLGGVRQVVALTAKAVVGIRAADGQVLWEHPWPTEHGVNAASPVVAGEFVFVSSDYGKGCGVFRVTGTGENTAAAKVAYFKPGGKGLKTWHGTAVHRDGFVYGFDSRTFRCFDLRAGELVAEYEGRDERNRPIPKGTVTRVGDLLLIQGETGGLYLADPTPTEFQLRGQVEGALSGSQCWATPTVVGGRIFTRDGEKVICLDARK